MLCTSHLRIPFHSATRHDQGGFVSHDNLVHSEVQLAARLRKAYPVGVDVQIFESYHGERALRKALGLLDTNHNGTLADDEKQSAQIIIYGHSWGGSEAITLARELGKQGVPVLLTIQVDSVSKIRQNDALIPANVVQAVNFYQTKGLLHGRSEIRAVDPSRTHIIGNFRFDYDASAYNCNEYPWYDRIFSKAHTQIECDPSVWQQAESLIAANLPPTARDEYPQLPAAQLSARKFELTLPVLRADILHSGLEAQVGTIKSYVGWRGMMRPPNQLRLAIPGKPVTPVSAVSYRPAQ